MKPLSSFKLKVGLQSPKNLATNVGTVVLETSWGFGRFPGSPTPALGDCGAMRINSRGFLGALRARYR
jgi:hypothetical protein